jgi:hypothetical protein
MKNESIIKDGESIDDESMENKINNKKMENMQDK